MLCTSFERPEFTQNLIGVLPFPLKISLGFPHFSPLNDQNTHNFIKLFVLFVKVKYNNDFPKHSSQVEVVV